MENRLEKLIALAEKYGTDKLSHGYLPFYAQHLPENPKKILEIGVKEGASISMWRELFPDTEIHGLDLFEEFPFPLTDEAIWHKGNQVDHLLLEQLRKEDFDVIIDDGSHNSRDQMMTFYGLFNGKHYFIEDVHCCRESFYRDGLPFAASAANVIFEHGEATIEDFRMNHAGESGIILFKQKIYTEPCY